jgi:uroporphyrin-III C-methyltransferase
MRGADRLAGRARGVVHIVGAGPGAPDLLTLRAAKVLERADIVLYDALVHPDTVALATRAEKIAVGKRCGKHSTAQQFINKRLVDAAARHAIVVRLKGGDPMLFGRAQEEIAALEAAGIRYEVVPGVTAALAATAELGISLTQRGVARSVAFATPRVGEGEAPSDWAKGLAAADSGAIYMGAGQARAIADALVAAGKSPTLPVAVVENASLPSARVLYATLGSLPEIVNVGMTGPAIIFVGPQYRVHAKAAVVALGDAAYEPPARSAKA